MHTHTQVPSEYDLLDIPRCPLTGQLYLVEPFATMVFKLVYILYFLNVLKFGLWTA